LDAGPGVGLGRVSEEKFGEEAKELAEGLVLVLTEIKI
jgi:hypothetical protein